MEVEWIESHARNVYRAGHKGKVTAAMYIYVHSIYVQCMFVYCLLSWSM